MLKPTKLCHNCFKPHQHLGIYCPQCDKTINNMNELLEKAKKDYPKGTKVKSVYKDVAYIVSKNTFIRYENVYTFDENGDIRCIYDKALNQWAEIIKEETTLLEKAKRDYPIGTKIKSMFNDLEHTLTGKVYILCNNNIQSINQNGLQCNIYNSVLNEWAEIINQNNMTQQEFNALRVGQFISQYEILHKYKEFLIVRCEDGHDLFDLNKINKLGLKVQPKTFMGLEIKKYDNVPCEIGGNSLAYLVEVRMNHVLIRSFKTSNPYFFGPNSIRIL